MYSDEDKKIVWHIVGISYVNSLSLACGLAS